MDEHVNNEEQPSQEMILAPNPQARRLTRKANAAEREKRINTVYELILRGYPTPVILQNIAPWGLSPRQNQYYIRWATKRIREVAAAAQQQAVTQMLARHADLRSRMYSAAQYADVLKVDQEDAKLMGLYPAEKAINLDIDWNSLTLSQVERIAAGEDILKVLSEVQNGK